jgi:sterol 3beta-glucosyltransferase
VKIGIQTWGSDGDILPFIALAEGLQVTDHEVTFAYSSVDNKDYSSYADMGNFSAFKVFEKFDVEMNVAMSQIIQCNDPLKQFVLVMEMFFDPAVDEMYQASKKLCVENDLVIGHMMNHTLLTAAEKYKIPRVVVALAPLAIRTKFVPLFGPNLGPLFNQLTWALGDFVGKKKLFGRANEIRKCEGLPPVKSLQRELYISKDLTLIASSPSLSHRQKDWGETIQICGDFNQTSKASRASIPDDLKDFISAGSPPIYMTFGSLSPYDRDKSTQLMLEAVDLSACRAIIQTDWNRVQDEKELPEVYKCGTMPHSEVFPHCAAVVHHGGAGTTHSALRAGCPSIIVEHAFDQCFWGQEMHKIGVSGGLLHRKRVTASQLAQAIEFTVNSSKLRKNAINTSKRMQSENGVKTAIALIEKKMGEKR